MKTLHVIGRPKTKALFQGKSLEKAAFDLGFGFNYISDIETDYFSLPNIVSGDLLYRSSASSSAKSIEKKLLNDDIGHIYHTVRDGLATRSSSFLYNEKMDAPIIETISVPTTKKSDIEKHVEHLGGFPVVVKVMGGSHGVGVIRTDTIDGLKSILDFVRSLQNEVVLRSFVPHKLYARLIVAGNKLAAAHCTHTVANEFRSNVPGPTEAVRESYNPSAEMIASAIVAVHSTGVYFGGVDFLIQDDGSYYISEVNTPCEFSYTERVTGINVAEQLVRLLDSRA